MSTTPNTDRKSAVSTLRFAIAPLTKDSADELTYGEVHEIPNNLITVRYTPTMNQASQFASGMQVDGYVAKAGGTLEIGVCGLNSEDETLMFGSKLDEKTAVLTSNKDDVVPDVMVIYSTKRSDGTINLYKFPKTKLTSQGETAQTSDDNGVTYQTTTVNGTYKPLLKNGNDSHIIKGLDISTEEGKAIEAEWFAKALGRISDDVSATAYEELSSN